MATFILYESASGYALFEGMDLDEIGQTQEGRGGDHHVRAPATRPPAIIAPPKRQRAAARSLAPRRRESRPIERETSRGDRVR